MISNLHKSVKKNAKCPGTQACCCWWRGPRVATCRGPSATPWTRARAATWWPQTRGAGTACAAWAVPGGHQQEGHQRVTWILRCCRLFDFKSKHQCQAALLLKGRYISIELKLIQKINYSFQRVHMRTLVKATPATMVRWGSLLDINRLIPGECIVLGAGGYKCYCAGTDFYGDHCELGGCRCLYLVCLVIRNI